MHLLSTNSKLNKQNGNQYLIRGLSMAPHGIGGHHVCPDATSGCKSACVLWFTGRTVMSNVREAMIRRKRLFFENRSLFYDNLYSDIAKHESQAGKQGLIPAVRLNVASDLDWLHIAADFPGVQFYDYSKVRSRCLGKLPNNYSLTYSWNEKTHWRTAQAILNRGRNISVVFSTHYNGQRKQYDKLPDSFSIGSREYPVIDGDVHDIRLPELDGRSNIVGLRFKGSASRKKAAIQAGFCVSV